MRIPIFLSLLFPLVLGAQENRAPTLNSAVESVTVHYHLASRISDMVRQSLKEDVERGSLIIEPVRNVILLSGGRVELNKARSLISALDVRPQTVGIDFQIFTIDREKLVSKGLSYVIHQEDSGAPLMRFVSITGNRSCSVLPGGDCNKNYSAEEFVGLMTEWGILTREMSPSVTTLSGAEATIEVGTTFLYSDVVMRAERGSSINLMDGRPIVNTRLSLRAVPYVVGDSGRIRLQITVRRSGGEFGNGCRVTECFQESQIEMMVANAQTAGIGGFSFTEETEGTTGVPILKDIPVVGRIFTTRNAARTEQYVIILVTPTLLQ